MTPAETLQSYKDALAIGGETISVRRYTGTGVGRVPVDTNVRARVVGYGAIELVGAIQQGDRKVIMLVEDLETAGFSLPVTANDKLMLRGTMLAIISVDDSTRRIMGELIAYEIQARG